MAFTYIVQPDDFVNPRICMDFAFKVNILHLTDVVGVYTGTEGQAEDGYNCWQKKNCN